MIGRTLGHYRIVDRLGTGGMGIVWLAEDQRLKRRVALKTLREDLAASPEKLARFEREAKAVAALSHPNIVTIHSIEEADGVRFLAMEYVEGRTLDELIPPGGFALADFLRIAIPVSDALAAAHARGITHRDLKPSNISVGADQRVKVLDFGLAKLQGADATQIYGRELQTTLTQEGTVVGTLHYMSPEQLQIKPLDHRTDLFSLGVVFFEMATGDLPFRGESAAQVISSVLRDQPRRLDELNERLPPQISQIVARCLEKDLARRIGSAAEVRDALLTVQRGLDSGSIASETSPLRRLAGRARRRPATVAASLALLALIAAIPLAVRAWRNRDRTPQAVASVAARPPAIAVLPLANFTGDPDYFVDGMTDGLISSLARIGGVRVISRQSAMHYKGSTKLLSDIAKELGVDYVVEGSIARTGDQLRLQAQLVRPDPEEHIWADAFDRPATDVLALHNTVAQRIAGAVRVSLSPTEEVQMASAKSVDPAVYEAYLQGRFFANKFAEEDLRKAQGFFERALALDPTFAPAWSGLADALITLGLFHTETESTLVEADAAAKRALQLDETLPEAYATLAQIAQSRWNWAEAERLARKAVELNPSSAPGHRRYWLILVPQHRLPEASREIEAARRLDPLSAHVASNLGLQRLLEGKLDQAESELKDALALDPDYKLTHAWLWHLYSLQEKDPERGAELRSYLAAMGHEDVLPYFDDQLRVQGYDYALRSVALRLADTEAGNLREVGFIAGLLAEAGEQQKAFEWLRMGVKGRAWEMPWAAVTPDFRSLHDHPDFNQLLNELHLPRPEKPETGASLGSDEDLATRS